MSISNQFCVLAAFWNAALWNVAFLTLSFYNIYLYNIIHSLLVLYGDSSFVDFVDDIKFLITYSFILQCSFGSIDISFNLDKLSWLKQL